MRWHHCDSPDALIEAASAAAMSILAATLEDRQAALIALPGGNTPVPAFRRMAETPFDWAGVTIIPGDDRLVGAGDALSNSTMLQRIFEPTGARVIAMTTAIADVTAAGADIDARLAPLDWPLDLAWIGIGNDGHTASILPGPDLDRALETPPPRRVVGVMPDPLPPEAPVARVTLTKNALLAARRLMIVIVGDTKRGVLERAIAEGVGSRYPIGSVLAHATQDVDIYWARG